MAINVYLCDTCDREIDIPENKNGIDTFGRCNITDGCKGHLRFVKNKPDHIVGQLTPDAEGLNNWVARKVLYKHEQPLSADIWHIEHNLGTEPSVQVHVYLNEEDYRNNILTEIEPTDITIIDGNNITITLANAYRGVAQCIARSTALGEESITDVTVTDLQQVSLTDASIDEYLVVATLDDEVAVPTYQLEFEFIDPVTASIVETTTFDFTHPPHTGVPWNNIKRFNLNGKVYTIRTAQVDTLLETGTLFRLTSDYEPNQAFIMLTSSPYDDSDIITDKAIDISQLNQSTNNYLLTSIVDRHYNIDSSLQEDLYPAIRILPI